MKILQVVELDIWSNFHVDHLDWITTEFELKFKYRSEFEFDLISNRNLRIWFDSKITMTIRVQMECLNFRDVTPLPPYRNLILRFRGEKNPRLRIGTGYLDSGEEDQDSWSEVISWSVGSLSFHRRDTKVYMMPYSQVWGGRHLQRVEALEHKWVSVHS
jgi:hypothetical protein